MFRIVSRPGSARLAIAAIALVLGLTHSQPLSAQFSKYGSPYGTYGGPYKKYDPDDDYGSRSRSEDRGDMVPFKRSGVPLLAVVGLDTQHLSIYDSAGRLIQKSPVSTGQTGYETPAGIFSVVQKKADHNSNIYEDGNMPFMQRITWTGIAMHGGVLPGHPASHGCVRLPVDFARRLFDLTDVGMRVIIVPHDIALAEFDHPHLLVSKTARVEPQPARPVSTSSRAAADPLQTLRSIATSKASEAEVAQRKGSEARRAATRNAADAASAVKALRAAEAVRDRADAQLRDAEKALETATSGTPEAIKRAETAKEKAAARLAEADRQLQTAKAHAQAKTYAATTSDDAAKALEVASDVAQDAAAEAKRKTLPISVFVSRKTQRFYVRQGYVPVFEGPITIRDPRSPWAPTFSLRSAMPTSGCVGASCPCTPTATTRLLPSLSPRARARLAVVSRQVRPTSQGPKPSSTASLSRRKRSSASPTWCCQALPSSSQTRALALRLARIPIL